MLAVVVVVVVHRPSDSRVLYALGYCYDQLEQYELAKKVCNVHVCQLSSGK